jgi:hypothetical protein
VGDPHTFEGLQQAAQEHKAMTANQIWVSTQLEMVSTAEGLAAPDDADLFCDGAWYRPLTPAYYAFLRSCFLGAQEAFGAGEINAADFDALQIAFKALQAKALEAFGKDALRSAVRTVDLEKYACPGTLKLRYDKDLSCFAVIHGVLDHIAKFYVSGALQWIKSRTFLNLSIASIEAELEDAASKNDKDATLIFGRSLLIAYQVAVGSFKALEVVPAAAPAPPMFPLPSHSEEGGVRGGATGSEALQVRSEAVETPARVDLQPFEGEAIGEVAAAVEALQERVDQAAQQALIPAAGSQEQENSQAKAEAAGQIDLFGGNAPRTNRNAPRSPEGAKGRGQGRR